MSLKKLFLTFLALLIFPFSNNYKNIESHLDNSKFSLEYSLKEKEIEVKIEKDEAKENLIDYEAQTKKNNEYLKNHTYQIPNFKDSEHLKNTINNSLDSLKNFYGKKHKNLISYNLNDFSLKQLQRIYLISEALKDSSFRNEIGEIIEKDVRDKYAEHGGIILFKKGKLYFKNLESNSSKDTSNNNFYWPPQKGLLTPRVGDFHLHATSYNEAKYANPSPGDSILSSSGVEAYNEVHEFLITPIKKGIFNVDYYGGDKTKGLCIKVLDLGNYFYDTLKTK